MCTRSPPAVPSRPSRGRPPSISEALPSPILRRLASPEVLLLSSCGSPLARLALPYLCGRDCRAGMTSQPSARVMSMPWKDRDTSTVLGRVSLTAWKPSLACSILTFSGNSYRRKESYTAVSPLERTSCARVVAWILPTLLCSAHAWAAIIAFRVRADCSVYCGGKAWKQKTS